MNKYFIKKYEGDDDYSWAVFKIGQKEPVVCGCNKDEVKYHKRQLEKGEYIL